MEVEGPFSHPNSVGAVVGQNKDDRVFKLVDGVQEGKKAPDLCVCMRQEARECFHLPLEHLSLFDGEILPWRYPGRAARKRRVGRCDTELLLPTETPLPLSIPALVERSAI